MVTLSSTAPGEVLDMQRSVYEYLRYPPAAVAKFYDDLFSALKAMSQRPDAARWLTSAWVTMFYPADKGSDLLPVVRRSLFAAPAYQVTADIVGAVTGTYEMSAKHQGVTLWPGDLPSPTGFTWLNDPVVLTDATGSQLSTRALSWGPQAVLADGSENDGVRFTSWSLAGDAGDEPSRIRQDGWTFPLVMQHSQFVPFGRELLRTEGKISVGDTEIGMGASVDDLLVWVHTLWMFMGAEIVTASRPDIQRGFRRRAQRSVGNDAVRVVTLRRIRHGDTEVAHQDIDWSCRWIVQAHERHLGSYEGTAEPHHARVKGPGQPCLVCGQPTAHIRAYVKGPDGMPLKAVPETVYRVAR